MFADPRLNKGTAFDDAERQALGLVGLLPPRILHLDEQAARSVRQLQAQPTDLAKHVFLTALHDRNEVLFYRHPRRSPCRDAADRLHADRRQAIERYSHEYRSPRGVYLSVDPPELVESSLRAADLAPDDVDLLVATDAEAILGIGDWGIGGHRDLRRQARRLHRRRRASIPSGCSR